MNELEINNYYIITNAQLFGWSLEQATNKTVDAKIEQMKQLKRCTLVEKFTENIQRPTPDEVQHSTQSVQVALDRVSLGICWRMRNARAGWFDTEQWLNLIINHGSSRALLTNLNGLNM